MNEGGIDPGVAALHAGHPAADLLGIELVEAGDGRAVCTMVVRPEMLNFFSIGHGGIVFTLADTTAGYACQSRGGKTVALSGNISFTAPARAGALLTARAQESARPGRTGIYDVTVTDDEGRVVALVRATSFWTSKPPPST